MGYSFYLISPEKPVTEEDFEKAMKMLSPFHKGEPIGIPVCDTDFDKNHIRIFGAFGVSGKNAEGFVLNMMINLIELGYTPKVISKDWNYGSIEDYKYLTENL